MTDPRTRLLRYLRQQAELGGGRIFLDSMTAAEALAAVERFGTSQPGVSDVIAPAMPPPPAMAPPRNDALRVLRENALQCTACRLAGTRTNVVFGVGNEAAELVVVGEAPGQEEDRTGNPFVGRAGKLLDLLLMTAGFPRESVYICNVLKCRPPENRNPLPDEIEACSAHLHGQLEHIAPRVLLAVGKFAAQVLVNSEESIGRLRGRVFSYRGTPLVVTYHPAYLLRSPQMTRVAWEDFQLVRRVLNEHG